MPEAVGVGAQGVMQCGLIALHVQIGDMERRQFTQGERTTIDFRNPFDRPADHRRVQFGVPPVFDTERPGGLLKLVIADTIEATLVGDGGTPGRANLDGNPAHIPQIGADFDTTDGRMQKSLAQSPAASKRPA